MAGDATPARAAPPPRPISPVTDERIWLMYILGNLMTIGCVVSEVRSVQVCFDAVVVDDDIVGRSYEANARMTQDWIIISLVYGLSMDVVSAMVLSAIYRAPLDMKSVHRIPPEDRRNFWGDFIKHFLAPLSFSLASLSAGVVSVEYADNSPCGHPVDSAGLRGYLHMSGICLFIIGSVLLLLSGLFFPLAFNSSLPRVHACCVGVRGNTLSFILSKTPYLDLWWQVQGAMWSYRTGSFTTGTTIGVIAACTVRETLVEIASCSFDPRKLRGGKALAAAGASSTVMGKLNLWRNTIVSSPLDFQV